MVTLQSTLESFFEQHNATFIFFSFRGRPKKLVLSSFLCEDFSVFYLCNLGNITVLSFLGEFTSRYSCIHVAVVVYMLLQCCWS